MVSRLSKRIVAEEERSHQPCWRQQRLIDRDRRDRAIRGGRYRQLRSRHEVADCVDAFDGRLLVVVDYDEASS